MSEPRLVEIDEMEELNGQQITVVNSGIDALAFRTEDGRLIIATICLGCGGHVGYYEISEDDLITEPDFGAS